MYSQIRIGVTGGYDIIDHSISSSMLDVENREGYQLGANVEILPFNGFGVETGILYGRKEFNLNAHSGEDVLLTNYDYIMIPLNLKLRFSFMQSLGVYAVGGAYGSVKLKGGDLEVAAEEFKSKNFRAGVNVGGGVSLFEHFDVGLYFRYSVTENFKSYSPDIKDISGSHTKVWSVKATYYF